MHTHFGNCVTSKAKGAHALLKKYLQVSTGDLCEVKNKICLAIENQFHEIRHNFQVNRFEFLIISIFPYLENLLLVCRCLPWINFSSNVK